MAGKNEHFRGSLNGSGMPGGERVSLFNGSSMRKRRGAEESASIKLARKVWVSVGFVGALAFFAFCAHSGFFEKDRLGVATLALQSGMILTLSAVWARCVLGLASKPRIDRVFAWIMWGGIVLGLSGEFAVIAYLWSRQL